MNLTKHGRAPDSNVRKRTIQDEKAKYSALEMNGICNTLQSTVNGANRIKR